MRIQKKKINPEELNKLLKQFEEKVIPWIKENNLKNLHETFEFSRAFEPFEPEIYDILRKLYRTEQGELFLKSWFKRK